jgi:pilus assembly protein CpaB
MLLQDVIVLKLGNFPLVAATATDPQNQDPNAQPPAPAAPDIVTLVVTPQDSITLSYLMYSDAQLSLTLRNPSDQSRVASEASTLQFLLSQYNIPVPAKLPYSMQPALTTLTSPALPNDAPPTTEGQ